MANEDKIMDNLAVIPWLSVDDLLVANEQITESGIALEIASVNWPEAFTFCMPVSVYLAHNQSHIFVKWIVDEPAVLGRYTEDNSPVYKDSCVEFFVQWDEDKSVTASKKPYINFEFNCLGAMRASMRYSRQDVIRSLTPEEFAQICRFPSQKDAHHWSLLVAIPFDLLNPKHYGLDIQIAENQAFTPHSLRANFYKCGDETAQPHYLSWQPILTPKPDFHSPEYFGQLVLEW